MPKTVLGGPGTPPAPAPEHQRIERTRLADVEVLPANHQSSRLREWRKRGEREWSGSSKFQIAKRQPFCFGNRLKLFHQQLSLWGRIVSNDFASVAIPKHFIPAAIGQDRDGASSSFGYPTRRPSVVRLPNPESAPVPHQSNHLPRRTGQSFG